MKTRFLALLAACLMITAGCDSTETTGGKDKGKGGDTKEPAGKGKAGEGKAGEGKAAEGKNIVETAVAADGFEKLVAAVTAADLAGALSGEGPFTVFAPTDEAFGAVEGLADLLKPENKDKLASILKYHVVSGKVMSSDITGTMEPATLEGSKVKIEVKDGKVLVGGATVVKADIVCSNGVIHVIDKVILPGN